MTSIGLSEGFQTAIPFLLANGMVTARRDAILATLEGLGVELPQSDVDALLELLSSQRERMNAVSGILTQRRKKKTFEMLPVSVRLLRERSHDLWEGYMGSGAAHKVSPDPVADSAAFGAWVVSALGPASIEGQLVRFELRRNAVMVNMRAHAKEGAPPQRPRYAEDCLLRLASVASMERFESAADAAMAQFQKTGTVNGAPAGTPVWLLFHPARGGTDVAVTRLSATLASILSRATEAVCVREVLQTIDETRRSAVSAALSRLTEIGVLQISG